MRIQGCMACSGDVCAKCKHWVLDEGRSVRHTQWGQCLHFSGNQSDMMIYSGNIDFGTDRPEVYTTSLAKCRYFEGR